MYCWKAAMSWSFPKGVSMQQPSYGAIFGAFAIAMALNLPAIGAEQYFRPSVTATVEDHSNIDLSATAQSQNIVGYKADLQGTWGIRTPRSSTELMPRLVVQKFQQRDRLSRTQEYLDLKTKFKTQLSSVELFGRFNRLDTYQSELVSAGFNDFDPGAIPGGQSGRVLVGNTRTLAQLRPRFSHTLSQRTDVGVYADYQHVDFSSQSINNQVDYDYGIVNGFVARRFGPKTRLTTGVFASKYETKDNTNRTSAVGVSVDWSRDWSKQLQGTLSIGAERSKVRKLDVAIPAAPVATEETATNWSATYSAAYRGEVSRIRFTVGRDLTPSSRGDKSATDQIRIGYDRTLTPRLDFTGAVRLLKERSIKGVSSNPNDRNYGTADLGLKWALTRTWFLHGEYRYFRQKYADTGSSAHDNVFVVSMQYLGLPPQR
jgi:hypothetical protein